MKSADELGSSRESLHINSKKMLIRTLKDITSGKDTLATPRGSSSSVDRRPRISPRLSLKLVTPSEKNSGNLDANKTSSHVDHISILPRTPSLTKAPKLITSLRTIRRVSLGAFVQSEDKGLSPQNLLPMSSKEIPAARRVSRGHQSHFGSEIESAADMTFQMPHIPPKPQRPHLISANKEDTRIAESANKTRELNCFSSGIALRRRPKLHAWLGNYVEPVSQIEVADLPTSIEAVDDRKPGIQLSSIGAISANKQPGENSDLTTLMNTSLVAADPIILSLSQIKESQSRSQLEKKPVTQAGEPGNKTLSILVNRDRSSRDISRIKDRPSSTKKQVAFAKNKMVLLFSPESLI